MNSHTSRLWLRTLAFAAFTSAASTVFGQTALSVAVTDKPAEWTITSGGQKLLVYAFGRERFKPCVKELYTLKGDNLLRDAPHDHLHHHALMYAIRVNGLNFWEELSGNGVEKPVASPMPELGTSATGLPQATIRQTLHWLAPQDAFLPDSPNVALLVEQRTLVLTVDQAKDEVALRWSSQFEVGGKTNTVVLEGANYFGLGVRFRQELDPIAEHFNSDGKPDLSDTKQDVAPHDWCAVAFDRSGAPATFAMFGHPANARVQATWFTMKRPFAYVSATQELDKEPLVYHAGNKWQVDYLVTVYPAVKSKEFLNARALEWRKSNN
jgi:hypothetical protein